MAGLLANDKQFSLVTRPEGAFSRFHQPSSSRVPVWDPNSIDYDPQRIYSKSGRLSQGQWVCDVLIRDVYQRTTRGTVYRWLGNPCAFKREGNHLSCSEYTRVLIHRLGVWRGIWEGAKRILRCNPWTLSRQDFRDPVFPVL